MDIKSLAILKKLDPALPKLVGDMVQVGLKTAKTDNRIFSITLTPEKTPKKKVEITAYPAGYCTIEF